MFRDELTLPGWTDEQAEPALRPLQPAYVDLKRISGALTNAVFFVSYTPPCGACTHRPPTVLLRVYGAGSESLLSRRTELLILHTLSSLYEIGPHIMGTFGNGRVEEFYECDTIGVAGMRDLGVPGREGTAQWVARRMRELHEVPLDLIRTVMEQGDLKAPTTKGFGRGIENHIMASSHRPRRRTRTAQNADAASPAVQSYSYFAHPSPLITRHSNASFDSLATSYDSPASFGGRSPRGGAYTGELSMSPLALGPSSAPITHTHAPYPGVWRRLKRWMREASKVIELVNAFLATPEGRAVTAALQLPAALPVKAHGEPPTVTYVSKQLRATAKHFDAMLKALLAFDLPWFCLEIAEYKAWVRRWEHEVGKSRLVFCHNDSQHGNLLKLRANERGELPRMAAGMRRDTAAPNSPDLLARDTRPMRPFAAPHQQLVVIDFEYASPNPRAFDIANHFNEWRANYNAPRDSWSHYAHGAYPSTAERRCWLQAYVEQGHALGARMGAAKLSSPDSLPISDMELPPAVTDTQVPRTPQQSRERSIAAEIDRLEEEVRVWSPATNAIWALWGIVIARDEILALIADARTRIRRMDDGTLTYTPPPPPAVDGANDSEPFDNLRFSLGRMEIFRNEMRALLTK